MEEDKRDVRENALKKAAGISISGKVASFSVEGSHSEGDQHDEETEEKSFSSNLSWEAIGGDTTLCNK